MSGDVDAPRVGWRVGDMAQRRDTDLDARPVAAVNTEGTMIQLQIGETVTPWLDAGLYERRASVAELEAARDALIEQRESQLAALDAYEAAHDYACTWVDDATGAECGADGTIYEVRIAERQHATKHTVRVWPGWPPVRVCPTHLPAAIVLYDNPEARSVVRVLAEAIR